MALTIGPQTKAAQLTHAFSDKLLAYYPTYVVNLLTVKRAAAWSNLQFKVIDQDAHGRIDRAIENLLHFSDNAKLFVADVMQGGGGIAINTNINEAIFEQDRHNNPASSPLDIPTAVNASQSTADVCATAGRLSIYKLTQELNAAISATTSILEQRIDQQFGDAIFPARTCLQDAMPTTFRDYFGGWVSALKRTQNVLSTRAQELLCINIGGTVIGSGEGAPSNYGPVCIDRLGELLKLKLVRRPDLYDAAQFSDDILRHADAVLNCAQVLGKIARDIRLLASGPQHGFANLKIPKVINGSSFFNSKNNPTLPETMIQALCLISGNHNAMHLATMNSELNLNVFEPMVIFLSHDNLNYLTRNIANLSKFCLSGIEPT